MSEAAILRCMKLTEANANDAILLYRVLYWIGRTKVVKKGKAWVVRSHLDWVDELGLSIKQVKCAVARLRDRGIIETETHLFANKAVNHLRIRDRFRALLGLPVETHQGPDTKDPAGATPVKGSLDQEIITDTLSGINECAHEEPDKEVQEMKLPKGLSTAEVLAQSKSMKKLHQPDTIGGLALIWKEAVGEASGKFVPNLNGEQMGQLKHLMKTVPDGNTEKVIRYVIAHWVDFALQAKQEAGLSTVPEAPHIGF